MSRKGAETYYNNTSFKGKKEKKKWSAKKKIIVVIVIILLIILSCVLGVYLYAKHKLGYMNYDAIDTNDLDVNSNLYNDVDTGLTKDEFSSVTNIVLFGSDSRNTADISAGRSDTIMICSINPVKKSIKLISIPRDTYVTISGYGKTKINAAYAYGQEKLSIKTINSNFGLNLDKYVTVDFSGLINVINKIGGVTVTIDKDEMNYINENIGTLQGYGTVTKLTKYGKVTLTGEQALTHSRNRTTGAGNDFARADRQRQVVEAMMKKVSTMSYDKVLKLSDTVLKDIRTNITSDQILALLAKLYSDKDSYVKNVISAQVPSTTYSKGQYISGIYYFVADMTKAKQDFVDYMYNK